MSVLIFSIIASAYYFNVNISNSYARDSKKLLKTSDSQYSDGTLVVDQNFAMLELAQVNGTMNNITSIDIGLPSTGWNVTEAELDFEDISQKNQTKVIEEDFDGFQTIEKDKVEVLAQQINITEHTKIFGVHLYGFKLEESTDPEPVYVQINGWNNTHYHENNTMYGDRVNLTLTESIPGWQIHTFPNPIDLYPGYYSLVLNGTDIKDGDRYFWWQNSLSSFTELYSSRYWNKAGNWEWKESQGTVFMHKFDQWQNKSYFPSEINMTAIVDGNPYKILPENEVGEGNRTVTNLDFTVPGDKLVIPIENNESINLSFNLTYNVKIKKILNAQANVTITDGLYHKWQISPIINRVTSNDSIRFDYSKNWSAITVYRGGENIMDQVIIDKVKHILTIPNNTIKDGASWLITANSTNIPVTFNIPEAQYKIGEKIWINVDNPDNYSNIICVLADDSGTPVFKETNQTQTYDILSFSYIVQTDDHNGTWSAFVFWNNETDAGFKTQSFNVIASTNGGGGPTILPPSGDDDDDSKTTTEVDYSLVIIAVIITGFVIAGGFASFTAYKKVMKTRELKKERLYNKFLDAFNLNNVIVINKKSGLNVYEQFFAGKKLDATLISGFLDAIRAFGIELTSAYEQSQSISLEYKDSKILMSEFKDFRIIFILKDRPSEEFLKSVTDLSYDIDRDYGELLEKFAGNLAPFAGIKGLIERHLNTSFISPLKIVDIEGIELSPAEISLVQKAKSIMKQNKLDYFFTTFLMPEQAYDPKRTELIFKLIEKKVFQPTDISFS
ncbi:MAG: hypothetical protein EU529_17225 [Promethearchaeota archaeon]|nr:MAG: hypothetical protein EU529_17225 [Candidatus Lokiarchaeota archaeon]